jgi:hypothetical protein
MKGRDMRYIKLLLICLLSLLAFIACEDKESSPASPTQPNTPPTSTFTVSAAKGNCPFKVQFDASGSSDTSSTLKSQSLSSKSINSYKWDFGDGNSKQGKIVNHIYRSGGKFQAKLTVTDNNGAETTSSKTITVRALTGGWSGWLNWDGEDVALKLYLLQQDRDLSGEVIWKYKGHTIYNDEITGRYKTDDTIDMMWADKRRMYTAVIIEAEPNKLFDRIDGRFYESGFSGQTFVIQKVNDEQVIPAAFNEMQILNAPTINSKNRIDLLNLMRRKLK